MDYSYACRKADTFGKLRGAVPCDLKWETRHEGREEYSGAGCAFGKSAIGVNFKLRGVTVCICVCRRCHVLGGLVWSSVAQQFHAVVGTASGGAGVPGEGNTSGAEDGGRDFLKGGVSAWVVVERIAGRLRG